MSEVPYTATDYEPEPIEADPDDDDATPPRVPPDNKPPSEAGDPAI